METWWTWRPGWFRLRLCGDVLLVHEEYAHASGVRRGRCFDRRTGLPLGPPFTTQEIVCLAEIPGHGPGPVLAHLVPETLVLSDPCDGTERGRIALPALGNPRALDDMHIARVGGRDLLHLFGDGAHGRSEWSTVPVDGTEPDPARSDSFRLYGTGRERLALDGGYLVVPAEEQRIHVGEEAVDVFEEPCSLLYRVDDGAFLGQCEAGGGGEAVVATVAGKSYLAQGSRLFSVPDLAELATGRALRHAEARALTEWEGRPVGLWSRRRDDVPIVPGRHHPLRLSYCFLDELPVAPGSGPTEIPWNVPGDLHDLLVVGERRIAVATSEGLFVLDV
ncbi:hypothetical protein [Nocardiopsis sp. MG754419]|uniref:hypothetical protein n=1 Tax=Nocardiopsis sp. MG754419 TaxID=2259865 RepID=UPI001BA57077|nr:hypothetical protein [Nocardiopsis sp. MG754419]